MSFKADKSKWFSELSVHFEVCAANFTVLAKKVFELSLNSSNCFRRAALNFNLLNVNVTLRIKGSTPEAVTAVEA
jgi:hypothetical protein